MKYLVTAMVATILVDVVPPANAERAQSVSVELSDGEHRMVEAINAYRRRHELPPLVVDATLLRVARKRAPHYSHNQPYGWCPEHARQCGFKGFATDNIAMGYETPEDAVVGWAHSDGHARQMRGYRKLNGRWENFHADCVGVGICGRKYCAIFGRKD